MSALDGIVVEQVTPWQPGGRMGLGDRLKVTFKWGPRAPDECGTAQYLNSGVSRDVYGINDKVCKFTPLPKAEATNIPEMGSASDFHGLVPACQGHFVVTVAGRQVSVLVTARVPETMADLFARLKAQPLTTAGGTFAVEAMTAVIAEMAWAAGEAMQLELRDWHT